jgi:D-serine deaminase-like pyridoxal phosphate-dependent protein
MVADLNAYHIDTPALLIDLDGVEKNLANMQKKADAAGAMLRPHIKTHKIPELAQAQIQMGAVGVTTAKISEAEVMADGGIDDIFIFLDGMQIALGVADPQDCALTVIATVISRPTPERAVIDAGSKVFALDKGAHGQEMLKGFGMVLNRKAVLDSLDGVTATMSTITVSICSWKPAVNFPMTSPDCWPSWIAISPCRKTIE